MSVDKVLHDTCFAKRRKRIKPMEPAPRRELEGSLERLQQLERFGMRFEAQYYFAVGVTDLKNACVVERGCLLFTTATLGMLNAITHGPAGASETFAWGGQASLKMGIEEDDVEDFVAAFFFRVHKSIRRQSEPPLSEALPKKILDAPVDTTASCLLESYYQCMLERERERGRD